MVPTAPCPIDVGRQFFFIIASSFFMLSLAMESLDIVSFFMLSLAIESLDMVSFFMSSAKAEGARARLSETAAAETASAKRVRMVMMFIPSKAGGAKRLTPPSCSTQLGMGLLRDDRKNSPRRSFGVLRPLLFY